MPGNNNSKLSYKEAFSHAEDFLFGTAPGDYEVVGEHMRHALVSVAEETTDPAFTLQVKDTANGGILPNPDALRLLKDHDSDLVEVFFQRFAQLHEDDMSTIERSTGRISFALFVISSLHSVGMWPKAKQHK